MRSTIKNLMDVGGLMANEDADRARVLNQFFHSLFIPEDHGATPPSPTCPLSVNVWKLNMLTTLWSWSSRSCCSFSPQALQLLTGLAMGSTLGYRQLQLSLAGLWAQVFTESMDSGYLGTLDDGKHHPNI